MAKILYYGMTKVEGIILNIIPTPVAVHEPSRQQPLEVYPNPASDVLCLKDLPCKVVEYTIFNMMGQKVAAGSSSGSISVAELGKGIYVLQIKGDKSLQTAKFMVK